MMLIINKNQDNVLNKQQMTPIQIIKNQLEYHNWETANPHETFLNWLEDNLAELLDAEKEIIVDAFFEGGLTNEPYEPMTGEDYYYINFEK
jgi:hypothetical protein